MAADGITEAIRARGHEHVSGTHDSTFEVTTDDWLTPAGDCILAVEADCAPASFESAFVERASRDDATLTATLLVGDPDQEPSALTRETATREVLVTGRGDSRLTFDSDRSLVCRTSDYVDDRTVMVEADAAAGDLDRTVIENLAAGAPLVCLLTVDA